MKPYHCLYSFNFINATMIMNKMCEECFKVKEENENPALYF